MGELSTVAVGGGRRTAQGTSGAVGTCTVR